MTTFRELVDDVHAELSQWNTSRAAFLTTGVDQTDRTLKVANAQGFDQGVAEIGDELVFIDSVDIASGTLSLTPDGRGYMGTPASAHAEDARVTFNPRWTRRAIARALNDTIVGTYPVLFGVKEVQFPYSVVQSTYGLPADAERVLSVQADQIGPSRAQQELRRWYTTLDAPSDEWASGKSITLLEGVSPGQTVTVTYRCPVVELVGESAVLTDSGLQESARRAVVYGAMAHLVASMDIARLDVGTAHADEFAEKTQVGSASRLSSQMLARYQLELEQERQRLRTRYPITINMRKR